MLDSIANIFAITFVQSRLQHIIIQNLHRFKKYCFHLDSLLHAPSPSSPPPAPPFPSPPFPLGGVSVDRKRDMVTPAIVLLISLAITGLWCWILLKELGFLI